MLFKSGKFYNYLNTFYFFKKKNYILKKKIIKDFVDLKKNFNKFQLNKSRILKHLKKSIKIQQYTIINSFSFFKHLFSKKKKLRKLYLFFNLKFKKNNVILSLVTSQNKLICLTSFGLIKIKTKRKKFDFFSMILLGTDLAKKYYRKKKQIKYGLNFLKGLHVKFGTLLKNFKFFYSILHAFLKKTKLKVSSFIEKLKIAHNGIKIKRVKRL